MKLLFTSTMLTAAVFTGCSTYQGGLTLAPVGPDAGQARTTLPDPTSGSLVVYSAFDDNPNFNGRDNYRPHYTDYRILADDGRSLRYVHNDSGTFTQDPVQVSLPPGNYKVIAHANGQGEVTVPVIIAAQKLTAVHLEGNVSLGE